MPSITFGPDGRATFGAQDSIIAPDLASLSLLKSVDSSQFTLGLAYPVMRSDIQRARDGKKDFVSAPVVELAAWRWMAKGHSVGLMHADGTDGAGTVVESYIYRNPDAWVMKSANGTEQTIVEGDWLMGVVWDDPGWNLIKSGAVRGFSAQGFAKRGIPTAAAIAQLRSR